MFRQLYRHGSESPRPDLTSGGFRATTGEVGAGMKPFTVQMKCWKCTHFRGPSTALPRKKPVMLPEVLGHPRHASPPSQHFAPADADAGREDNHPAAGISAFRTKGLHPLPGGEQLYAHEELMKLMGHTALETPCVLREIAAGQRQGQESERNTWLSPSTR